MDEIEKKDLTLLSSGRLKKMFREVKLIPNAIERFDELRNMAIGLKLDVGEISMKYRIMEPDITLDLVKKDEPRLLSMIEEYLKERRSESGHQWTKVGIIAGIILTTAGIITSIIISNASKRPQIEKKTQRPQEPKINHSEVDSSRLSGSDLDSGDTKNDTRSIERDREK